MSDNNEYFDERLLSVKDAMKRGKVSRSQLSKLRNAGKFPPTIRIGARGVRFHASEFQKWMNDPAAYVPPESAQSN